MADFEFPFASSGTPTSFPIGDTGFTGIDQAGTLTPIVITLDSGIAIVTLSTVTHASVLTAMHRYLKRNGTVSDGGAGGRPNRGSLEVLPTETNVGAAD